MPETDPGSLVWEIHRGYIAWFCLTEVATTLVPPGKETRKRDREGQANELPPPREEISSSREGEKTSKEMREEREREREKRGCGSKGRQKDEEEQEEEEDGGGRQLT